MLDLVVGTITQGLLWSLLAVGVFITFRVLDVADLTVEGSFPMGAAISAILITSGMNPVLSIVVAGIGGMIAGAVTGWIHTKLKIPALLAGILTMIALYSVNLHIMGKANVSLLRMDTVYTMLGSLLGTVNMWSAAIVGVLVAAVVCLLLFWFFGTEIGTALRSTGVKPQMIRAQGVNTDTMIVLGLLISNAFVAVSGALIGQAQGFADVGMGIGTIVIAAVLYMGMPPNDLKLFTAILVAIALSLPTLKAKWLAR